MKKFKYSETGQFTKKQRKLCEDIRKKLEQLQKSGCAIIAHQDTLDVFLEKELKYSNIMNLKEPYSCLHPIPFLNAGKINDCGADSEFFIDSALEPEENEI